MAVWQLTSDEPSGLCLTAGEPWADRAVADIADMPAPRRAVWKMLLDHAARSSGSKPHNTWKATAIGRVVAVGADDFADRVTTWFPRVAWPRTTDPRWAIGLSNANVLRGLAWMAATVPTAEVARALARLCSAAMLRGSGKQPRLPAVADAAVLALGEMKSETALSQLTYLRTVVTDKLTARAIEVALDRMAARLKLTRDELAEAAVPTCGFGPGGVRVEVVGSARVEQRVASNRVVTTRLDGGDPLPDLADLRRDHPDEMAQLDGEAADAAVVLAAQRARLDGLMGLPRTWPAADWRRHYLDHPLVGTLARRLLWTIDGTAVLFDADGSAADLGGNRVDVSDGAVIALWHPAGRPADEVVAWRERLEQGAIRQPFKQAHREVYPLTDAERTTRTYSNRFAGHVVHQHQFNDVVAARGWRHQPRLAVGDDLRQPPRKLLPDYGLRAEFWVEGTDDPTDTPARTYRYLATDQVRFYRAEATANASRGGLGGYVNNAAGPGAGGVNEPLPLDQVPPLAFSEVMRDVDLFVGAASVGNDPTWQDGGPGGRYRTYWQSVSFGDLSVTAKTRREVLERLIPKLKIADRCTLAERFLVVRGERRTYKIHLGSGNVLMEPNDQYLCIVRDRSAAEPGGFFRPFEDDGTLSVILSKAFLLAADDKISDPTINRQIGPNGAGAGPAATAPAAPGGVDPPA